MAGQRGTRKTRDRRNDDVEAPADTRHDHDYDDDARYDDEEYDDDERNAAPAKQKQRPALAPTLSAAEAAETASHHVADLTGKPTLGVTALKPSNDGWTVGVEVLEDSRIPSSADILATYEADIDEDGTLLAYHRVRSYPRGRGDGAGGG